MKKSSLFLIGLALISINAFSQLRFGIRAGLTSSSLNTSSITANGIQYQSLANTKAGFQGGVFMQAKFFGMFLQPEFLLSSSGGEVKISDVNTSQIINQHFTKLDIPVLVGKTFGPLRVGIGPVASIILSKPSDAVNFSSANIKSKFNSATFGFQAGLGLDLWKLAIDLKYEGNLSKLGNGVTIDGTHYNFDSRNHQWILGIGLFL